MKKDKHKTEVLFLLEQQENCEPDCFAYFPKMYYNKDLYKTTFTSYSHIGQHSACRVDYAKQCKIASKDQYKDLLNELESLGYNLKVINKS